MNISANVVFDVTLKQVEGAMVRLLGTVERRGHRLTGIKSEKSLLRVNAQDLRLELDCGERSPDVLLRQLNRLQDVLNAHYHRDPGVITGQERNLANV